MTVKEQIKETKDNGVYIECDLIGDGSSENPFQPEVFLTYKGYYHLDTKDIDYTNKKAKVWVNKIKTKNTEINKMKADSKLTVVKETNAGVIL